MTGYQLVYEKLSCNIIRFIVPDLFPLYFPEFSLRQLIIELIWIRRWSPVLVWLIQENSIYTVSIL